MNILGLQIFPGVATVTDELVLRVPEPWLSADLARLVEGAGGTAVSVGRCTEHSLVDGPVHYLHALHRVAHDPGTLAAMLARLLDADAELPAGATARDGSRGVEGTGRSPADLSAVQDTMTVDVGSRHVVLRRTARCTATEHARAVAFADVAADLLGVGPAPSTSPAPPAQDTQVSSSTSPVPPAQVASPTRTGPPAPPRASWSPTPVAGDRPPALPIGSPDDAAAVARLHDRCSSDSLDRRYGDRPAAVDDRTPAGC